MNTQQARARVAEIFPQAFNRDKFLEFSRNLLNKFDESKAAQWNTTFIKDAFKPHIARFERLGTYTSPDDEKLDVLIVHLTNESKLERTRTAIRNFVADHLKTRNEKDAALVAFVSPTEHQWRFSYVKMEYSAVEAESGKVSVETRLTPARRFSYIVGEGESCHTAQSRFLALLQDTENLPTLAQIEDAFSVEAVTKEFFSQYAALFDNIESTLKKLSVKDKTIRDEFQKHQVSTVDFSKKLMGQIVFLYFLQKKGWLGVEKGKDWGTGPHDFLRRLAGKKYGTYNNFFNDILEPLFYDTLATDRGHEAWCPTFKCRIPFLNGGLFEPLGDYDWRKTDIILPNEFFTNTDKNEAEDSGTGILDVFDRYNFTVNEAEPLEKEVAIDPEMLGKVFENLIEDNRRKGLGSFYTPREIVHYMCQESLINYLDTSVNSPEENVPRADLETFVHLGDQISHYEAVETRYSGREMPKKIKENAKLIDEKLANITVCDPAVGSGAFPVGMMTEIVRNRFALTPYFNDPHERGPYFFKRHAIQNCLYGVDIDPGAVEIAKLRLWLSLVVDEEDIRQIKPLPNLSYKIVTGNSLLGVEKNLFNQQLFRRLEELKPRYFDEPDKNKKSAYKHDIEKTIHELTNGKEAFDFEIYFSEVFSSKGGFDVVIANPPYGIVFDAGLKPKYELAYPTFKRNNDLYVAFYHLGVGLAKQGGILTYISPNTFLNGDYFKKLRELLTAETVLKKIWDYKSVPIFDDPTVFVCVFTCTKESKLKYPYFVKLYLSTYSASAFQAFEFQITCASEEPFKCANQILKRSLTRHGFAELDAHFFVKDVGFNYWTEGRGKKRGQNSIGDRVFYSGSQAHKQDIPFLKGRDIIKWNISEPSNFLRHNFEKLLNHADTLRYSPEYLSQKPKIVYRQTSNTIIAASDSSGRLLDKTVHMIVPRQTWNTCSHNLLLAILNSKLSAYFYRHLSQEADGRTFAQVKTTYIKKLPIPVLPIEDQKAVESLVDRILAAKARDAAADVSRFEQEIDELVYKLYGLTLEEKAIVEGSVASEVVKSSKSNQEIQETDPVNKVSAPILPQSLKKNGNDHVGKEREKQKDDRSFYPKNESIPVRIDQTEQTDVLCTIRQVFSEGLELTREDAFRKIAKELGYDRVGPKIEEILDSDIRTAVKRGILENERGTLKILCKTIDGYEREFLKVQFLASIGRPWVEREEAVRAFTRFMGFRRAGEKIQDTVRSLINGLLREDRLESDGQLIRRKS